MLFKGKAYRNPILIPSDLSETMGNVARTERPHVSQHEFSCLYYLLLCPFHAVASRFHEILCCSTVELLLSDRLGIVVQNKQILGRVSSLLFDRNTGCRSAIVV